MAVGGHTGTRPTGAGGPTGRVAQPQERDAWSSTAPCATAPAATAPCATAPAPTAPAFPAPASIATVRQPRNSHDASTTQATRPRPATVPSGTVPGATPAA